VSSDYAKAQPASPQITTYNQPTLMGYNQVSADHIPALARTFVRIDFKNITRPDNTPLYFDENGDKHYLSNNHWSNDIYFWQTVDGQQHQFHLKPDGTFPTIAEGIESNRREAQRLRDALPLITEQTHELCYARARDTLLDPTSFRVTSPPEYKGNLDRDAFEGLLYYGKIVARNRIGNIAPGVIVCGYDFANGKVVLKNFSVGNSP
jgi:hypothetical protein